MNLQSLHNQYIFLHLMFLCQARSLHWLLPFSIPLKLFLYSFCCSLDLCPSLPSSAGTVQTLLSVPPSPCLCLGHHSCCAHQNSGSFTCPLSPVFTVTFPVNCSRMGTIHLSTSTVVYTPKHVR